jgi:YihY family inner membrane protein
MNRIKALIDQHPNLKLFVEKIGKDNIGMLAGFISWSTLTSMVPILVGLVAITTLFLRNPSTQATIVSHLSQALPSGSLSKSDVQHIVKTSTQHGGLLGLIGLVGIFWGGSNVGGSISTAFQAVFEVAGRNFIKEKLIDIGMIFVFTILMLIIIVGNTAGALVGHLASGFPIPGVAQWVIGTVVSLASAFLLFATIYLVFPNIDPPFKFENVWRGALLSAVLFWLLSFIWPLYAAHAHFGRYGTVLAPLLVLTAYIYFFAMILMLGGEVVAFDSIRDAQRDGRSVGPVPQENTPQHAVLRNRQEKSGKMLVPEGSRQAKPSGSSSPQPSQPSASHASPNGQADGRSWEEDPAAMLLAATPLVVAVVAGAYELLSGSNRTS